MNLPVIVPTSDDIKPCEGRNQLFTSTNLTDHQTAKALCNGHKTLPPCPFIGWCHKEREAFQTTDYKHGLHGTWHGVLFVDGKVSHGGRGRSARQTS